MKANEVIDMVDEMVAKPFDINAAKPGDNVMFKPGTPYAGMAAYVVQIRPAAGKVDVKFGVGTRMDVDASDLVCVDQSYQFKGGSHESVNSPVDAIMAEDAEVLEEMNAIADIVEAEKMTPLQKKLKPSYDKLASLDARFRTLHRKKERVPADMKKGTQAQIDKVKGDMDAVYANIRKIKGKPAAKK